MKFRIITSPDVGIHDVTDLWLEVFTLQG